MMTWGTPEEEADIVLTSYPRSGSHFLLHYLEEVSETKFCKTHEKMHSKKPTFSIIRNPFDSIASLVAMTVHFDNTISHDEYIIEALTEYVNFYEYLKGIDYIFSYDKVILNPDPAVHKILAVIGKQLKPGLGPTSLENIRNNLESLPEKGHSASSTSFAAYNKTVQKLKDVDLSKCFSLYEEALSRISN